MTPLYPFGYGLSYTQFKFGPPRLSATSISPNGQLTVDVEVENIGQRTGDEVVQLYIRDDASSVTRPVKELKGFQRITLRSGEKRSVQFTLKPEHLGFYNREMRFVVEPGTFKVMVGPNSEDLQETSFEVVAR
ncbi:MAG TPA: fibronectin type III-like domain-contianing protein [Pyrinomonadaceae bacterium]|nr:fibronectin type III-like domain-contianing protein [Pyrinomonadaceae bacterium]